MGVSAFEEDGDEVLAFFFEDIIRDSDVHTYADLVGDVMPVFPVNKGSVTQRQDIFERIVDAWLPQAPLYIR